MRARATALSASNLTPALTQSIRDKINHLGKLYRRSVAEIEKTYRLALGASDIAIVLEHPPDPNTHDFSVSFEEFVQSSQTLSTVNELIRFATRGTRDINNVSVLYAFPFVSSRAPVPPKILGTSQQVVNQILKRLKPRLVLQCHTAEYNFNYQLKRDLQVQSKDYRLAQRETIFDGQPMIVLQSFDISIAIHDTKLRPEFRVLMLYHFLASFSGLKTGAFNLPESAETIRKMCTENGLNNPCHCPVDHRCAAALFITEKLDDPLRPLPSLESTHSNPSERRKVHLQKLGDMYLSLSALFCDPSSRGAIGIATVLEFWSYHFENDPLFEPVMTKLYLCGVEQNDWLPPTKNYPRSETLDDEFSGFQINDPNVRNSMLKAIDNATAELVHIEGTGVPKLYEASRTKLIHLVEVLVSLVTDYLHLLGNDYLCASSEHLVRHLHDADLHALAGRKLAFALQLRPLLLRCEWFLSAISEEDPEARATNFVLEYEDLPRLILALQQLRELAGGEDPPARE